MKKNNYSANQWDQRAEAWESVRQDERTRKDDERIHDAVNFLRGKGLLLPEHRIADIGCGPGRFAVAFAKTAGEVIGFDISEKMIHYGKEHAARRGQTNVELLCCDFQHMDIEQAGYASSFDLVFSSLTPAIHDLETLKKSIAMSRGFCCNITHVSGSSQLETQIAREVFGREPLSRWDGTWFRYLSKTLEDLGYKPELSYYDRHQEKLIRPDEAYLQLLLERLLPTEEQDEENRRKLREWFAGHADINGLILEVSDARYGRTFWDVRK